MRRRTRASLRIVLTIMVAVAVCLQAVPMRAVAEELSDGAGIFGNTSDNVSTPDGLCETLLDDPCATGGSQQDFSTMQQVAGPDMVTDEGVPATPPVMDGTVIAEDPSYTAGMLTDGFVDSDGHRFDVTVTFDELAGIPAGAQLSVSHYDGRFESVGWKMDACVHQALVLGERDGVLATSNLDVSIWMGDQRVEPKSDVSVTVVTDAIEPAQAAYTEAVVVDEMAEGAEGGLVATKVPAEGRAHHMGPWPSSGAATETVHDNAATITIVTPRLGTFSLARVATRSDLWSGRGLDAWVWVPRKGYDVSLTKAKAPQLEDGLDQLACYEVDVRTQDAGYDGGCARLLVEATRNDASIDGMGVSCYVVDASDRILEDPLFGPEGTDGAVVFGSLDRRLLFVQDSGFRNKTVRMGDVTVEGMMPQDADGVAVDVTERYRDHPATLDEAQSVLVAQGEGETSGLTAIAAFDISLMSDGVEYQPSKDRPLTVTIEDDKLRCGHDVAVLHVADDGSVQKIDEVELKDGSISFTATGFSTYLLVQAESSEAGLPTTFRLNAYAGLNMCASDVRFVDSERNPLNATITSAQTIGYTGGGKEKNDKNSIDMYEFADKLDPSIADEYEFSRVFVQLSGMEKDFRYVQVADAAAIGQASSVVRAYFHMASIDENASGRDYFGAWYQLSNGGGMGDIYIEYHHVAPVSFKAIDTRGDPVAGAQFALFTDSECLMPLEYKDEKITAVSDEDGNVSFGKILRGTYYMRETSVPAGYKKSIDVHEVTVDGSTTIDDVVHEDDDGSIIISDVVRMTLTKEWDDGAERHARDSVELSVHSRDEEVAVVVLSAYNNWTAMIDGLDPNESYMVSETLVSSDGADVTNGWIPDITYKERDQRYEYCKATQFRQNNQYVMLTTTASGTRALVGDTTLTTVPLEGGAGQVTGTVTDDMLWGVEVITRDGALALKNEASGAYLDQNGEWFLNSSYPDPLYVRHINDDGSIKLFHRANPNNATPTFLCIHYQKGDKAEGTVDSCSTYADKAASFDIYQRAKVRSVDVTIANGETRYPVALKSVDYPSMTPLPDVEFNLYAQKDYESVEGGAPLVSSLKAGEDGYVRNDEGSCLIELGAGTYYLCRTSDLADEGYAPLGALKFTITRGGDLRVAKDDQEVAGFEYSTTETVAGSECPVLQVPAHKESTVGLTLELAGKMADMILEAQAQEESTVELTLEIAGEMADMTREFEFEISMPEGMQEILATVAGEPVTLTSAHSSFVLSHGQSVTLEDVPSTVVYQIRQTCDCVASGSADTGLYVPEVTVTSGEGSVSVALGSDDMRVVTLTDIVGTREHPARITLTNRLESYNAPATGIGDNASVWGSVVLASLAVMAVMRGRRFVRRR